MTRLPIRHLTLYKHGVGFFERGGRFSGNELSLTFRVEEMNDVLKSLTIIDHGDGQVLGVDYATPQSREERLQGNSIRLGDSRSLRDLIAGLRGRDVALQLDQGDELSGTLVGIDELPERQPVNDSLVSILVAGGNAVEAVSLGRITGITIRDEEAARDLRFFLETALSQEAFRRVNVRLAGDVHDLSVAYVAPAPTWRVSYRLVAEDDEVLLLGWGIFDNRLEEDLEEISLTLVAGMPISFIYDLYTPFTPERPEIGEEGRVAAGPVEFEGASYEKELRLAAPSPMEAAAAPEGMERRALSRATLRDAAQMSAVGEDLGELFEYKIGTPVSVGRGQSAMVPIVATDLSCRRELIYNGRKMEAHPVATLRLTNSTGLTLERGPVTVLDGGMYVGEALLPFTAQEEEFVVPYAVELNVQIQERNGQRRAVHALHIRGAYLVIEEWDIRRRSYQINNHSPKDVRLLVEHPRTSDFELFESGEPAEHTAEQWRFAVDVAAGGEYELVVQTRRLLSRREQLQRQSYAQLQRYLRGKLLDRETYQAVAELLRLWEQVDDARGRLSELENERDKVYRQQQQIQGNMQALSAAGPEGKLRTQYVRQLEESEERLRNLADEEEKQQARITELEEEIARRLQALQA
jgi:hypothetical protein